MTTATVLLIALVLDAIFGEPDAVWARIPHPAVAMGRLIAACEARFNTGPDRRRRGILVVAGLSLGALVLGRILSGLPLGWIVEIAVAAALLAHRSLIDHVGAVAAALRNSVAEGRTAVGRIVGRDTAEMDGPAITRAAIESAAENFSDGVVAPAFWFLIGGLPGLIFYKLINTADSMIGYRTPELENFGWAAAKLDDLLNWVPARISAWLIAAAHGIFRLDAQVRRDARQHRSPNAGWPEAAMAACLNVALAGPRRYHGQMFDAPFVRPDGDRYPGPEAIDRATAALWRAWAVMLGIIAILSL